MTIVIIGGGLAGLAAAVAAVEAGGRVELFEQRAELGGRAGSFVHPRSAAPLDFCPHVAMACCTNLIDLCRRTGVADGFRRCRTLHFVGPDAARSDFTGSRWLPAPLHLLPALWRQHYLSRLQRRTLIRTMGRLARQRVDDDHETAGQWLRRQGESDDAIERFWSLVVVSALGERPDRVGLGAMQKVFRDGFLASRNAYELLVPQWPLGEIWGRVGDWLTAHGASLHLGATVAQIEGDGGRACGVTLGDGTWRPADAVVVAVPWHRVKSLIPPAMAPVLPALAEVEKLPTAAITAVDLWFDRPITPLPHTAIVGRLSQWLFAGAAATAEDGSHSYHYRVVISGSQDLAARPREEVLAEVQADLQSLWPAAREAQLLHGQTLTRPAAVFVLQPGVDRLRPMQRTPIANFALAGDWTATGWPATMESAVRSGYLAAEAVLQTQGMRRSCLVPELSPGRLARWFFSNDLPSPGTVRSMVDGRGAGGRGIS